MHKKYLNWEHIIALWTCILISGLSVWGVCDGYISEPAAVGIIFAIALAGAEVVGNE